MKYNVFNVFVRDNTRFEILLTLYDSIKIKLN